jgi:hypothetical protein
MFNGRLPRASKIKTGDVLNPLSVSVLSGWRTAFRCLSARAVFTACASVPLELTALKIRSCVYRINPTLPHSFCRTFARLPSNQHHLLRIWTGQPRKGPIRAHLQAHMHALDLRLVVISNLARRRLAAHSLAPLPTLSVNEPSTIEPTEHPKPTSAAPRPTRPPG